MKGKKRAKSLFLSTLFLSVWPICSFEEPCIISTTFSLTACSDLAAPQNGSVSVDGTTTGSTASYSCDIGFELVGEVMRVCMSDSEWSGTPPVCRRKSHAY